MSDFEDIMARRARETGRYQETRNAALSRLGADADQAHRERLLDLIGQEVQSAETKRRMAMRHGLDAFAEIAQDIGVTEQDIRRYFGLDAEMTDAMLIEHSSRHPDPEKARYNPLIFRDGRYFSRRSLRRLT